MCVCNGKSSELNVGVCSKQRWGSGCHCSDAGAKRCRARAVLQERVGGAGAYSRLATVRPQLQHSVINKQVPELKKSGFPFICFLIFLNIRLN